MKYLFLISSFLMTIYTTAQENQWCGTDAHNEAIFNTHPELRTQMHEHLRRASSGSYISEDRDVFTIPVVVHILHNNGAGNISVEQVQSGIDMLNEDFNRENADAVDTRDTEDAPFLGIAADMEIRFELAKIDPDGNCTNGIQRRFVGSQSFNANNAQKHYSSGGLDAWDRNYYFNIWIVNSIASDGAGMTLGYAEFPYGGGSTNYGVIIRNDAYGTVGTASGDRTLSHEVGHCLGLLHTFQGSCHSDACNENGDYCCDTPPVSEAQWSCLTSQNTCDDIPSGDPYGFDAKDQFENFMSYSPCQNMFSQDQKNIVHFNLTNIGFLENLVNPDHFDETGIGLPAVLCKAQFMSDDPTICAGNSIQFYDDSYANVTDWTWTFEGGTPNTSTEENPVITYNTPGMYPVTLEVSDGLSSVSNTMEGYVLVMSNPGISLPYSESFETIGSLPDYDRFMILDEDEEDTWEINSEVGYSGNHCAYIPNRGNNNETLDELISGTIDLSGIDPDDDIIFNFKYAYKKRYSGNDEWLRFFISNDCGETWALRKNIHGDDLSEETQTSSYTPSDQSEWVHVDITNINSTYYSADFRYKFQFENDNGNNIYIDDINMYAESMTGIKETVTTNFNLTAYPNPTQSNLTINLTLASAQSVNLILLNALGQEIATVYSGHVYEGETQFTENVENLPAGVYFVRSVNEAGDTETIRFLKQ